MSEVILRLPTVKARSGLSRSNIYEQVRRGAFPPPVKLGKRAIGWLSADIERWIKNRAAARSSEAGRSK